MWWILIVFFCVVFMIVGFLIIVFKVKMVYCGWLIIGVFIKLLKEFMFEIVYVLLDMLFVVNLFWCVCLVKLFIFLVKFIMFN